MVVSYMRPFTKGATPHPLNKYVPKAKDAQREKELHDEPRKLRRGRYAHTGETSGRGATMVTLPSGDAVPFRYETDSHTFAIMDLPAVVELFANQRERFPSETIEIQSKLGEPSLLKGFVPGVCPDEEAESGS